MQTLMQKCYLRVEHGQKINIVLDFVDVKHEVVIFNL